MYKHIHVRERNFGRPFTIWQSRTSSNKGPLEGSRQTRRRSKPAKRNRSRFNRCSTGASARACAASYAGEITDPQFEDLKFSNTISIDARQALETPSACSLKKLFDPRFGSRCRRLLPKVFIPKIFNRTFLLILKGSRRDPGLVWEEVLASVRFSSRSINKTALNVIEAFLFLLSAYNRW